MVVEDDVDMESLQAQIDMSMSFAHNLVTSWIKPTTHFAQLRSSDMDATQILEEELHRPPRLGVGASIPTAPPLAHETSKLKRRLGKNGTKNEAQPQHSSKSDDEEHKGRPAKRKTRVDPFGHGDSKKKRKADSETNRHPSVESVSKHLPSLLKDPQGRNSSPGKEKQRVGPSVQWSSVTEGQRSTPTSVSSPPVRLPVQTMSSSVPTAPTVPSLPKLLRETCESGRVRTTSMSVPGKANSLDVPLLNLDGPPELTDKLGNTNDLNNSKRKRKRRKKKKTQTIASTGDNTREDSSARDCSSTGTTLAVCVA